MSIIGPPPILIVKIRIGVPSFVAAADHEGRGTDRGADISVLDQFPAGSGCPLPGRYPARRRAEVPVPPPGHLRACPSARLAPRGFSGVDMLAGLQRGFRDGKMLIRTGQIDWMISTSGSAEGVIHGFIELGNLVFFLGGFRPARGSDRRRPADGYPERGR